MPTKQWPLSWGEMVLKTLRSWKQQLLLSEFNAMLKYILRPSKQRPSSLGERIKQRNIWATTNGANLLQSEKNNIKNSKAKKQQSELSLGKNNVKNTSA